MTTKPKTARLVRIAIAACASVMLVFSVLASPARADGNFWHARSPGAFYLSLGDSMGFGLQFGRLFKMLEEGTYKPSAFNKGYTDVFAARMRSLRPDLKTVNLSCPGESAATMIAGGCFFTTPEPEGPGLTLHRRYEGPQLDAAVRFLRAHRGEVNPITVAIGGNDVSNVIADECDFDAACVQRSGIRWKLAQNLDRILHALRAAAPRSQIIVVSFYNPFTLDAPASDGLWDRYYTQVQRAAAQRNYVGFHDLSHLVEKYDVCNVTLLCADGDPHPTNWGYRLIGNELFDAAGYE